MFINRQLFAPADPMLFLSGAPQEPEGNQNVDPEKAKLEKEKADKEKADKEKADKEKADKEKKGKATPEQIAELRKQRDDLAKELEDLKKIKPEHDELKGLKPVAEYIKTKFGKIDEDAVNKFIDKGKGRKKDLEDLDKKYKEKENVVRDLEIQSSDLWREDYVKPLRKAMDGLVAEIVMIDGDGKIRYPEQFDKLNQRLLEVDKEGKPKNSIQIKQTLREFAKEFKTLTQEDYEIPDLTKVTAAVESVHSRNIAAVTAKKDWEKTVEEKNKEKLFDSAQKQKRDNEAIIIQRGKVLEIAKDKFEYKKLADIVEEDLVKEKFDVVHKKVIDIMTGKEKPTEYDEFTTSMVKASLYDEILAKYEELKKTYEKELDKKYSSLSSSSERRGNEKDQKVVEDKNDPVAFLKS